MEITALTARNYWLKIEFKIMCESTEDEMYSVGNDDPIPEDGRFTTK